MPIQLEASWLELLSDQFQQPYFLQLKQKLATEKQNGMVIFPPRAQIFTALDLCPVQNTKVVILGQDPYHNPGQAHGLSFSVPLGTPAPPSLINIFKELEDDLGIPIPNHGNLESWARQGVLLLNATLTVQAHLAASHARLGWTPFTDCIIQRLSAQRQNLVFMLWGNHARAKKVLIAPQQGHLILETVHPSPLSAHRGFLGCRHFSTANDYLKHTGQAPIRWQIDNI